MAASVRRDAAGVSNEDEENPVELKWKWGEEEGPIVDQVPMPRLLGLHKDQVMRNVGTDRQNGRDSRRFEP